MSTERKNHSAHTVCDEPVFRKRCASRTLRDLEKQPNFLKEKQNNMIPNFIRYLSGKFHWPMPLGSPMVARMPDRDHIQKPPFFEKYWDYVHRSLLRLSGSYGQIWPCLMNARPAERELFPQGPRTFTTQLGMAAAVLHSYIKSRRTHSSSPCSSSFKASLEPTVLAWNFSRDKELSLLPCHLRDKCTSFLSPLSLFTSYFRLFSVFFFCFCALEITVIRSWTRQRPCKSIVPAAANASSEAVKQCVSSMRPENILLRRLLSKAEGKL